MIPTMWSDFAGIFPVVPVGGDPAYILAGKNVEPEADCHMSAFNLDQPYYIQLWIFIKQILTFNFGNSWSTGEAVSSTTATRRLHDGAGTADILETLLSIALALAIAFKRGSFTDRSVMILPALSACRSVFWSTSSSVNTFSPTNSAVSGAGMG